jgi:hypothetical protein
MNFCIFPHRAWVWPLLFFPSFASSAVSYRRDVQPILADHCFHCHGQDAETREGGLRLDIRAAALSGGESDGPAIVPGKPEASALIQRLLTHDQGDLMPPPKAKNPVSPAEIEVLKRWIIEGAEYSGHWAFEAPQKTEINHVEPGSTPHPVDALVQKRLAQENLTLSETAPPELLARRLYLDLTGLPPSPEELATFKDQVTAAGAADAVNKTVAHLLQSPHYGERWARVWLDAARYADSNGYEKDMPRDQWAWRDWVVTAFNKDMPYDRFIIEQIAGDLLPNATQEQVIATGFLRNSMINEEGAIVPEQFRMDAMFDRMDCVGKATVGLSLQCAQCHTHKFDPITHDEYFGLFAFLNNTYEAQSWVYTAEQTQSIQSLHSKLASIYERLKKDIPDWQSKITDWEKATRTQQATWQPLIATKLMTVSGLNHPTQLQDHSILTLGHPSESSEHQIFATPTLQNATGLRIEALTHQDLPHQGPGHSLWGTWALSELEVHTKSPSDKEWVKQTLQNPTADFAEPDHRIEEMWIPRNDADKERRVGPVAFLIDGNNTTGWRADRGPGRRNTESVAVVQFAQPLTLPAGTEMRVTLRMNHGGSGNGRNGRLTTMLGCCRLALTTSPAPKTPPVDYAAQLAMQTSAEQRTREQQQTLLVAWAQTLPAAKALKEEATKLWATFPAAPPTSVLHLTERAGAHARPTHLLDRGAWDNPKHEVKAHVPAALHPLPPNAAPNRLTLAHWLVDKRSPLAARVAVNRVWQALFGTGLVETSEDFGTRTPEPEHRAVLDWLAADFMEHGWSQKHLLRTLLTSRVYQQSSKASPALLDRDPNNRLLARGPRFRADAEVIRDIALTASGLMNRKTGGPSLFPPVPQNVLDYNYFPVTYWVPPIDGERYRRSLYLFRKRSMPDPVLSTFDSPNGDASCARRPRSNTPLGALTGLNETIFVEAAQALAQRVLRESAPTETDRLNRAWQLCTSRLPTEKERQTLLKLLTQNRERLRKGELKAGDIAFSAFTKPETLPPDATPNDLAAWTLLSRVLLNLDETVTKS